MRCSRFIVEQGSIGYGDDTGRRIDRKPPAGVAGQRVGRRIARITIEHTQHVRHASAIRGIFRHGGVACRDDARHHSQATAIDVFTHPHQSHLSRGGFNRFWRRLRAGSRRIDEHLTPNTIAAGIKPLRINAGAAAISGIRLP